MPNNMVLLENVQLRTYSMITIIVLNLTEINHKVASVFLDLKNH